MPKIIAPVTDRECRAAKSTMGVGGVKGLYLRVWEGAKTFQLRYRISGRVQFKTLGSYPKLSLSQARKDAAKFLEEVEVGSASSFPRRGLSLRQELSLPTSPAIAFMRTVSPGLSNC